MQAAEPDQLPSTLLLGQDARKFGGQYFREGDV